MEGRIGAGRRERSGERAAWRDGHRERTLDARLGPLELRIAKLGTGPCFAPFPEARITTEKALLFAIRGRRGSPAS